MAQQGREDCIQSFLIVTIARTKTLEKQETAQRFIERSLLLRPYCIHYSLTRGILYSTKRNSCGVGGGRCMSAVVDGAIEKITDNQHDSPIFGQERLSDWLADVCGIAQRKVLKLLGIP
jgi:hypothetical protein